MNQIANCLYGIAADSVCCCRSCFAGGHREKAATHTGSDSGSAESSPDVREPRKRDTIESSDEEESFTAGGVKASNPFNRAAMNEPLPQDVFDQADDTESKLYDIVLDYMEWAKKKSAGFFITRVLEPLNIEVDAYEVDDKKKKKKKIKRGELHYRVLVAPGKDIDKRVTLIVPALAVPDEVYHKWKQNEAR